MRPFQRRFAAVRFFLPAAATLALATPLVGQSLLDPVVDPGEVRFYGGAQYLGWSERFGLDSDREPLATDLVRESAAELVPGVGALQTALESLVGASGPFRLGASQATVSQNEIRVPLALDIGVIDRITVGVTVPMVRTLTTADIRIAADDEADLGLNPAIAGAGAVPAFLDSLGARTSAAVTLSSQLCGDDPASAACIDASALADDLGAAEGLLADAYAASGLFPATGTASGEALTGWMTAINDALAAQGLAPLSSAIPLAAEVLDHTGLQTLLTDPSGPFRAAPLASYGSRWGLGDVEARIGARLLEGERIDSAGVATLAWSLAAIGTVRLPTGTPDSAAVFLDRGLDDGQMDLEGGAWLSVATPRFSVQARALYTLQQPGDVQVRIAPYGEVFATRGDLVEVERDPGDGISIEVEPAFRLAPAIALALSWRMVSRGEDRYTGAVPLATGDAPVATTFYDDVAILAEGTEYSLQEVGGSLTYRSRGLPETSGGGFETFLRVRKAIAGSGGRVPAGVRTEFGLRLVRRLWGG